MQIDTDTVVQDCMSALNDKMKNMKKVNIMVIGKSGVGKSTLINSVFRGNLAEVGIGEHITDTIRRYTMPDYPLAIYDTPGFELSGAQQVKVRKEIYDTISKGYASKNEEEKVHCIWYCINCESSRLDPVEIQWLKEFTDNSKNEIPVIVILTQAFRKAKAEEMKKFVESKNLKVAKVLPVLAQDARLNDRQKAKAYGLETLIEVTTMCLPNDLSESFQNVQKVSLKMKKKPLTKR